MLKEIMISRPQMITFFLRVLWLLVPLRIWWNSVLSSRLQLCHRSPGLEPVQCSWDRTGWLKGLQGGGGGEYSVGLSRYQWRKQSSTLMRGTETYGTGVRRIALEPLAPIPATKPGLLVKTGKSIPIKGCSADALCLLEIIINQKPTTFFMDLIVYHWIWTGDAF